MAGGSFSGAVRAGQAFVEIFADDRKLRAGLRNVVGQVRQVGQSVGNIGTSLTAGGGLLGAPLLASTAMFGGFEAQMAKVKAFSTDISENAFGRLREQALKLGATTQFTAAQAAEGMAELTRAGFSAVEVYDAIPGTMALAAAGQLQLGTAASITASAVRAFGKDASEASRVADVLAVGANASDASVEGLGEALKYVGPLAHQAGVSFEEVIAAIMMLSDAGIKGETAGTTIRGGILALSSPTNEAAEAMQRLGIRAVDASGKFRKLHEIIADMTTAMGDLPSGTKLQALNDIFWARQATGFSVLLEKGADALQNRTRQLEKSTGAAARMSKTLLDTISGDVTILKSAFEGLGISIGSGLSTSLRTATQGMTEFVGTLAIAARLSPDVSVGIGKIALGMLAVGGSLVGIKVGVALLADLAIAVTAMGAAPAAMIAGMAVLAGAAVKFSMAWDQAFASVSTQLSGLPERMKTVGKAAQDAIGLGDMEGAAKIAVAGLEAELVRGIATVKSAWIDFAGFLEDTMFFAFHNIMGEFDSVIAHIEEGKTSGLLGNILDWLGNADEKGSRAINEGIGRAVLPIIAAGNDDAKEAFDEDAARIRGQETETDKERRNFNDKLRARRSKWDEAGRKLAGMAADEREQRKAALGLPTKKADQAVKDAIAASQPADAAEAVRVAAGYMVSDDERIVAEEFFAEEAAKRKAAADVMRKLQEDSAANLKWFENQGPNGMERAEALMQKLRDEADRRAIEESAVFAADASVALKKARKELGEEERASVLGTFDARAVETFGQAGAIGPGAKDDPTTKAVKDGIAVSKQIKDGINKLITLFNGFQSDLTAIIDPGLS